ncbi:MAG: hypothetical protein ABJD97_04655 [Betaproteobacteria bacterium]
MSDLTLLVGEWLIVAQARDRVPLSWLCLFDSSDLEPCQLTFMEPVLADGVSRHVPRRFSVLNPTVSVQQAKANLARARPVFDGLAGAGNAGARHWQEAMDALAGMTLEYLTIDPTKALVMEDLGTVSALYAAAFSSGPAGLAAKRRIARLDVEADPDAQVDALDGGFLEPGEHLRRTRSPEEAREIRARIATLAPARAAPARAAAPAPAPAANTAPTQPPDNFWADEPLLAHGRRQAEAVAGASMFTGVRRYYRLSLTNRSSRPIRVRTFAGFALRDGAYVLSTQVARWFDGQTFVDWYGAPPDGWIAPGQTVAHLSQSAVDQEEAWAYWCEDDAGAPFMTTAPVAKSASGGRSEGISWMVGLPRDEVHPMSELGQREIDRLVAQFQEMTRATQNHISTLDVAGVRWVDKAIDEIHASGDRSEWGWLIPMFGAFLGEVTRRMGNGGWLLHGEIACVHSGGALFFPYQTVVRRLVEGRKTDTTMLGMVLPHDAAKLKAPLRSQIRPSPADPAMADALGQLRDALAQRRATMHPRTLAGICGPAPSWMKPADALREAVDRQALLLAEGTVVWAALVQANKLLFKAGPDDCPAQVVYSRDTAFDAQPQELRAIAQRIFKLKGSDPKDPLEKRIADKVTNEMDRTMGWRLPIELTDRPVFSAALMVWRQHIPAGVLSGASFPVLAHPDTQAVMIVPVEFWPIELVQLWKKGKL